MAAKKNISFEAALGRLDEIVELLDKGDAPLDDALKLFGEGAELVAFCGGKLEKARLTIETILPEDNRPAFESTEDNEDDGDE